MYSLSGYGEMIADRVRMDAYVSALRQSITPDSVVLDIGTGAGIFALIACQLGARKVYAIEPGDVIEVAKLIAQANGYADRIEFIHSLSTGAELPELATISISDMRGVVPLFQHHVPSIIDARKRLLDPAAILIPARDTLWAAIVGSPNQYRKVNNWSDVFGLDQQAARRMVTNSWWKARVTPEDLLVEPQCWGTLDYASIESPDMQSELSWEIARDGTGYGVLVWFDTVLAEGIGFSNRPHCPELIYGSAFFPWSQPVTLSKGDVVRVFLAADLINDDYVWRWTTRVDKKADPTQCIQFKQSTFFGTPLAPDELRKRAGSYLPKLNQEGEINRFVLVRMDGATTSQEIARELVTKFPGRFSTFEDALARVGVLAISHT